MDLLTSYRERNMKGLIDNPNPIPCRQAVDLFWDKHHEKRIALGGLVRCKGIPVTLP
jgi:hypothetical protein